MITTAILDRFLAGVKGQALREGRRYARQARVDGFVGSAASATTRVRGHSGDFDVALWVEAGQLDHRCSCPSWRNPCKHEVAAATVLRQQVSTRKAGAHGAARARASRIAPAPVPPGDRVGIPATVPGEARQLALKERQAAARREKLSVKLGEPPSVQVTSASGFSYRVHLRGDADGPHSCDCPDFEANRLHTCKHVERVRRHLRRGRWSRSHREAAGRPRVYLHFGEVIEPRLLGRPSGRGAPAVRAAFDEHGLPRRPLTRDERALRKRLAALGRWVEPEALAWLDRRIERRPVLPRGELARFVPRLRMKPYPYQWKGASFLARAGRALLADEMGLGKTVQAILAAAALRRARPPARHVTIVCPASLRGGWADEIRRWLSEDVTLLSGRAPVRHQTIASRPTWLITHYEQVLRDGRHHEAHPPDLLIVDEAQRAKGLATRTARALKAIGARYLFALTGTPLENRLEEAYAIAQLIDQRLLPPLWQIDRDHFVRDARGRRVVLYQNLGALRARLAPAFLRRRKEDVALELPDRVRSIGSVEMHPAVIDTYDEMIRAVSRIARKKVLLPGDFERMQRLLMIARRCCNGPHMLGKSVADRKVPKLVELEQALRDLCLGEGRKAVVFSEWTDMTERVEALCRRLRLPAFHLRGDVPVRRRPALIRAFTKQEGPAAFISTDAGGLGLNLQAADVVINLDLPWNPARLEQRIARAHRIGSKGTVQELLLVTRDSLEESILGLHDTKRSVLDNVWAQEGEDVIAAPGGSGAFRDMVQALLEARGWEPEERPPDEAVAAGRTESSAGAAEPDAESPQRPSTVEALSPPPRPTHRPLLAQEPARATRAAIGSDEGGGRPDPVSSGASGQQAASAPVDPAALAAAVAAVAPVLPPDQRRSLAAVFRALAGALDQQEAPAHAPRSATGAGTAQK
ncbi:MAG: SNF2-related protein [Rhodospirillales bacterium]